MAIHPVKPEMEIQDQRLPGKGIRLMKYRYALIVLLGITLTGCMDYRSGKHWKALGDGGWERIDKQEWANNACGSKVEVSTEVTGDGVIFSLFFVPILPGQDGWSPEETTLFIKGDALAGHCSTKDLIVRVNEQVFDGARISACQSMENCCVVAIPVQRDRLDSIALSLNIPDRGCSYPPLNLGSRRHFCMSDTRFGGSEPCDP